MKKNLAVSCMGAVGFAVLCAGATEATAADADASSNSASVGLEEIVITAEKKSENLRDVPITVDVVSTADLENHDVKTLQDLQTMVPGFSSPGDNGTSEPHLRGVGNAIISPGNDSGVSYYLDGVYMPTGLSTPISLSDSKDVEVLKGPQGTLFGRNSTAGIILITTRDPNPDHWEEEASVGYGNYDTTTTDGFFGGPVTSSVSTDIAYSFSHQGNGWGRDFTNGQDDDKFDQADTAHNKWIAHVTDSDNLVFNVDWQHFRGVGTWDYVHYPNQALDVEGSPWNAELATVMTAINNLGGGSLKYTHDFDFATLSNIAAYRQATNLTYNLDSSASAAPSEIFTYAQHAHEVTEELNLSSRAGGPFQWTVGGYFFKGFDSGAGHVNIYGLLPDGAPFQSFLNATQHTSSYAGYAQATYAITESTKFTLGGRYTWENRELFNVIGPQNPKPSITADVPTWKAALTQDITQDVNVYASASRGFKSGGFNLTAAATAAPFKPEYLTAFELGTKGEFFDKRLRVNLSGFYYDYSGIQITTLVGALETVYNAAAAQIHGADLDMKARVTDDFSIGFGAEALKTQYTDFPNCTIYTPIAGGFTTVQGSCNGNSLLLAPSLTFFVAPEYTLHTSYGSYLLAATYDHNSGYYASPDDTLHQASYGLLGVSLQLTTSDNHYWVRAWGKNLTNEVTTSVFGYGGVLGEPVGPIAMLNAPRTYGITVGVKF
jgi:iron complex outermembrane recepter protein